MIFITKILKSELGKIFSGNIVVQITTVLQAIIVSRLLGPEGKGHFIEILLWPTIISGFSILGLYTGIAKLSADTKISKHYSLVGTTFKATCIVGVIGSIVSLIVTPLLITQSNNSLMLTAMIFSSFVLINNVARGFSAIDHGQKNFTRYSVTRSILNPIFFILILICFIFKKLSVESLVLSYLAANFIVALIRILISLKDNNLNLKPYPLKSLLKNSIRYAPSDLSEPIYAYYDKAIVALVLLSYDLGVYTTAYSAAGLINIVSNVYGVKLFSDVASDQKIDYISSAIRQNIIIMVASAIIFAPLLPILIPLVFGSDFNSAIGPAILLIITCIIQGLSYLIERGVLALGYPYMGIKAKGIYMLVMAVLAFGFKFMDIIGIYSMIGIMTITQLLYFTYMFKQLKSIGGNFNVLPTKSDINHIIHRIRK